MFAPRVIAKFCVSGVISILAETKGAKQEKEERET